MNYASTCVMLHFLEILGRRVIAVKEGSEDVERSAHLVEHMSDKGALRLRLFLHNAIAC